MTQTLDVPSFFISLPYFGFVIKYCYNKYVSEAFIEDTYIFKFKNEVCPNGWSRN